MAEKAENESSIAREVPWSLNEPTVTMNGSLAGEVTVPGPSLPAAATTVTPENHAASTSAESRSLW